MLDRIVRCLAGHALTLGGFVMVAGAGHAAFADGGSTVAVVSVRPAITLSGVTAVAPQDATPPSVATNDPHGFNITDELAAGYVANVR